MRRIQTILPVLVVVGVIILTTHASRTPAPQTASDVDLAQVEELRATVTAIDNELERVWLEQGIAAAEAADDLTVLRRLSLALHGTIPSLEEIRAFEADQRTDRLDHWLSAMLEDDRFNAYFAERLARSFVGVEQGQFLVFRRDRFSDWLQTQLREHAPYDQIVTAMISGTSVWTGNGETNFVTSGFANDEFDANKLTARTVRAFLGQRMDCAQCHDHPFDDWKQDQFEGLAAHFGQVELSLAGVTDRAEKDFVVQDRITLEDRSVAPGVPFHEEWVPAEGTHREKLAGWVTHPDNQRFERAIANRVWALMFGRPYLSDRPVDDLPSPDGDATPDLLDLLGADFRAHGCDLRRLVQVVAGTNAFRQQSQHPLELSLANSKVSDGTDLDAVAEQLDVIRDHWAVFPLIRLRPEQVIGAMLQANNIQTIDQNSHLIVRAMRFFRERDFVDEFGDPGVDELQDRAGTIPQALLRMNGQFARELTEVNPLFAPGRVSGVARDPEKALETIYLVCLTRRPTEAEREYFVPLLTPTGRRGPVVEDVFWTLFNSPEFSWNH